MPVLPTPALRHVFDAFVDVGVPWEAGATVAGERRVIAITGGRVEGQEISGSVLPGGADYQVIGLDGLTQLHARYAIETDRGERIYVENTGLRFGKPDALERLRLGLPVDPALIYFRTVPRFETSAPRLSWLQTTIFVASGAREPGRVVLSVFSLG